MSSAYRFGMMPKSLKDRISDADDDTYYTYTCFTMTVVLATNSQLGLQ